LKAQFGDRIVLITRRYELVSNPKQNVNTSFVQSNNYFRRRNMKNELSEEDLEKIREIVHDEIGKLIRAIGMTLEQLLKEQKKEAKTR
jgi:hypothetical protein